MVLAEVEDAEDGLVELERMKAAMRVEDSIASLARRARASATLFARRRLSPWLLPRERAAG